jgi:hypothetical protein
VAAVVAVDVVVTGSLTHWFGLKRADPHRATAIEGCQLAVRHVLTVPSSGTFDGAAAVQNSLYEDDRVRLGFDANRVTAVWGVSGVVASTNNSGAARRSRFTCRAYFFEDNSTRTSVDFGDVDISGQRKP